MGRLSRIAPAVALAVLVLPGVLLPAACGKNPQRAINETALELQKKLPMEVEPGVTCIEVRAAEMKLEYEYLFTAELPPGFSRIAFQDEVEKQLTEKFCNQPSTRYLFEKGVSALIVIRTPDDQHLARVLITPIACGL